MRLLSFPLAAVSVFLLPTLLYAVENDKRNTPAAESILEKPKKNKSLKRFQNYGPSYVLFQQASVDDDSAMEIEYSFKYIVYNCKYGFDHKKNIPKSECDNNQSEQDEYYFAYTGKFDFYVDLGSWGGRNSSPVVNRVSNPSFHWRTSSEWSSSHDLGWIDVSFEHRSNGQVTEIDERDDDSSSATFNQLTTQIAAQNGDYAYFDGLSRGSNYFKVSSVSLPDGVDSDAGECNEVGECASYRMSVKIYVSQDTEVNWGRYASTGVSIADYDVVRLGYSNQYAPRIFDRRTVMNINAEYTFGLDLWEKHSLDIGIALPYEGFNGLKLPWYIKMHFGPMNNLSNYTKSQNSIGVGVLLTD